MGQSYLAPLVFHRHSNRTAATPLLPMPALQTLMSIVSAVARTMLSLLILAVTANFQNSLSKQTRAGWPALRGLLIPAVRCAAPWAVTVSDARAACHLVQTKKKKRTQTHLIDSGATEVNRRELKRYVEEYRIHTSRQTNHHKPQITIMPFASFCVLLLLPVKPPRQFAALLVAGNSTSRRSCPATFPGARAPLTARRPR